MTKHILIQATDTTKILQTVSIDIRLDFTSAAVYTENVQSYVSERIHHAISKLFNEDAITVTEMSEQEYLQMINNGQ